MSVAVPSHLTVRLMHEHAAEAVRVTAAGRARAEHELRHRRREPEADRDHLGLQRAHRVVDREAVVDRAAGRVDVEHDRLRRRLGVEHEQLRAQQRRGVRVDRSHEHHPAPGEQPLPDLVCHLQLHGCTS